MKRMLFFIMVCLILVQGCAKTEGLTAENAKSCSTSSVRSGAPNGGQTTGKVAKINTASSAATVVEPNVPDSNAQLIQAAKDGNLPTVQTLLAGGADVNAKDTGSVTALIWAAAYGREPIVRLLIENGAEIDRKDDYGLTALFMAAQNGHIDIVKLLIEKGAGVNAVKTNDHSITILWMAARMGRTDIVKLLLENGAEVDTRTNSGNSLENGTTPLWIAAQKGYAEVVKLLAEKGADINVKNDRGWTALASAAGEGRTEVVKVLLERGADVNAKNKDDWTALMFAALQGHTDIVKLLLDKGADVNAKDNGGVTALMRAAQKGHTEVVKLLMEKGADVSAKDKGGKTALSMAKSGNHADVVQLLLGKGTDVNAEETTTLPSPQITSPPEIKLGTGFAISGNGLIATAYHVIADAKSIKVYLSKDSFVSATILRSDPPKDLAVLKIDSSTSNFLQIAPMRSVKMGDKVFTIGFPVSLVLGKEAKYTEGVVSSISGIKDTSSLLQITVPVQPGNSGGPLVNEKGEVVGIITSSAAILPFVKESGTLPQNINWAVKADYLRPLIELPETERRELSREQLIDCVKKATFFIESQ